MPMLSKPTTIQHRSSRLRPEALAQNSPGVTLLFDELLSETGMSPLHPGSPKGTRPAPGHSAQTINLTKNQNKDQHSHQLRHQDDVTSYLDSLDKLPNNHTHDFIHNKIDSMVKSHEMLKGSYRAPTPPGHSSTYPSISCPASPDSKAAQSSLYDVSIARLGDTGRRLSTSISSIEKRLGTGGALVRTKVKKMFGTALEKTTPLGRLVKRRSTMSSISMQSAPEDDLLFRVDIPENVSLSSILDEPSFLGEVELDTIEKTSGSLKPETPETPTFPPGISNHQTLDGDESSSIYSVSDQGTPLGMSTDLNMRLHDSESPELKRKPAPFGDDTFILESSLKSFNELGQGSDTKLAMKLGNPTRLKPRHHFLDKGELIADYKLQKGRMLKFHPIDIIKESRERATHRRPLTPFSRDHEGTILLVKPAPQFFPRPGQGMEPDELALDCPS